MKSKFLNIFIFIFLVFPLVGCVGEMGLQGSQGEQGIQGPQGEQGPQGVQGEKGEDGHTPELAIGENGNWYIDGIDTGIKATGEKGEQGIQGPQGEQGIQGPQGGQGIQGVQGEQGIPGKDGVNGKDGTSLLTGNGAPTSVIGIVGDSYIDLDTWDFYVKSENGWKLEGNIKGEDGKSAYEIYLQAHPDYNKSENEWLDEIINCVENKKCTVTFDSDGGSEIHSQTVYYGETISKPENPEKLGYRFEGWYLKEALESSVAYEAIPWNFYYYNVSKDITLVAKWVKDDRLYFTTIFSQQKWEEAFCYENVSLDVIDLVYDETILFKAVDYEWYANYGSEWECCPSYKMLELIDFTEDYGTAKYNGEYCYLEKMYYDDIMNVKIYFDDEMKIEKIEFAVNIQDETTMSFVGTFKDYGKSAAPEVEHNINKTIEQLNDHTYVIDKCSNCAKVFAKEVYGHNLVNITKTYGDTLKATGYCTKCSQDVTVELNEELSNILKTLKANIGWGYYSETLNDGTLYEHFYDYDTNYSYVKYSYNGNITYEYVVVEEGYIQYNANDGSYSYGDDDWVDYWWHYCKTIVDPLYDNFYHFIPNQSDYVDLLLNEGTVFSTYDEDVIKQILGRTAEEYYDVNMVPEEERLENPSVNIMFEYRDGKIIYPLYIVSTAGDDIYGTHFGYYREFITNEYMEENYATEKARFDLMYEMLIEYQAK